MGSCALSYSFFFFWTVRYHQQLFEIVPVRHTRCLRQYIVGSIMVGHRYWMPPPRQFQPMFQVLSTINCYATSSR